MGEYLILDLICFVISLIYYFFPPFQFIIQLNQKILNKEYISCFSLFALFLNGTLFFIYSVKKGLNKNFDYIEFCNLIGALLSFIFITCYYYNIYEGEKLKIFLSIFTFTLGSILLILICYIQKKKIVNEIIFYFANIANVIMYISMGFNVIKLISNKSPQTIVLNSSIIGLINCIIWEIYGLFYYFKKKNEEDQKGGNLKIHVIITNILGIIICSSQIFFYNKFSKINNEENANLEENLNNKKKDEEEEVCESNDDIPPIFNEII
jgi:uncharacterized protein with PQ loop repeat